MLCLTPCVFAAVSSPFSAESQQALRADVPLTFMAGGAVLGGEGGRSSRGTLEMVSNSCFLQHSDNITAITHF